MHIRTNNSQFMNNLLSFEINLLQFFILVNKDLQYCSLRNVSTFPNCCDILPQHRGKLSQKIKNPSNTKSNDNTDVIIKLNENIIGSLKNSIIMPLIVLNSLMQNTQMTFL